MPTINVKLCRDCMQLLLLTNPYVDAHGKSISTKGIKIRPIASQYCDHHAAGKVVKGTIKLTALHCNNCFAEHYILVRKGQKPVCPACKSTYLREIEKEKEV